MRLKGFDIEAIRFEEIIAIMTGNYVLKYMTNGLKLALE